MGFGKSHRWKKRWTPKPKAEAESQSDWRHKLDALHKWCTSIFTLSTAVRSVFNTSNRSEYMELIALLWKGDYEAQLGEMARENPGLQSYCRAC